MIKEYEKVLGINFALTDEEFIQKIGSGGVGSTFIPEIYVDSVEELKSEELYLEF